jgi:hypothetical protein
MMSKKLEHSFIFVGKDETGEILTLLDVKSGYREVSEKFKNWKNYNKNPVQELYQRRRIFEK